MHRFVHSRIHVLLLVLLLAVPATALAARTLLATRLVQQGPPIDGVKPTGGAAYAGNDSGGKRLAVHVRRVKLPAGTVLDVDACGDAVGTITLASRGRRHRGHGRLVLSTRKGDDVPTCSNGNRVTVEGSGVDLGGSLNPK